MTSNALTAMFSGAGPEIFNHLWQSTLFAVLAGLLTLALCKNQARTRYWLWLAASLKFLIPFSLLIALGSHFASHRHPARLQAQLYLTIGQVSQPLVELTNPSMTPTSEPTSSSFAAALSVVLAAVWLCGFIVILTVWCMRWRRVSACMRDAVPLREGREWETLLRLQRRGQPRPGIELRLSQASTEPGIFGIFKPVILWPQGISKRLDDAHLEAILEHEACHVRRRDNLTAALHMLVEAIFWFHPLVWWLGARLLEERERACDEEVLQLSNRPQVYAEGILKVCEFCLESRLPCVSGVTGADLKQRIVRIMSQRPGTRLTFSRKLLLVLAGATTIAVPVALGLTEIPHARAMLQQLPATSALAYDVVSIKPNKAGPGMMRMMNNPDGFAAINLPAVMLLVSAYNLKDDSQLVGLPGWVSSEHFDVEAKMDAATVAALKKLSPDEADAQRRLMLQALLADRFQLKIHHDTKDLQIYTLVVAKGGPKLKEADPNDTYANGPKGPDGTTHAGMMMMLNGELKAQGIPLSNLTRFISQQIHRQVLDGTGLKGKYDINLRFTRDEASADASDANPAPSLFTALQEQLGLKLDSSKGPADIIVIEHIEQPSGN